jgi:hypothetical protein
MARSSSTKAKWLLVGQPREPASGVAVESRRRNLGNERDKLQGLRQLPTPLES